MHIVKVILNILIIPLLLPLKILSTIFKPKNNLLEFHFNYDPLFVYINTIHKDPILSDNLIMASYILFLARFFYVCDKRQIDIINNILKSELNNNYPQLLPIKIYNSVLPILNNLENYAIQKLFPQNIPPLTYSEKDIPNFSLAKYSFHINRYGDDLVSTFHMSSGPDIILLPITVGIFYKYVLDKLQKKDNIIILKKAILELLNSHENTDCRSFNSLYKSPSEIIKKICLNQ